MGTLLYGHTALFNSERVAFWIFDDHLEWKPRKSSARFWLTPIVDQLALSPLAAQAQRSGTFSVAFNTIEHFSWFERDGQINIWIEGAADYFYFHLIPKKEAREAVAQFDPLWKAARASASSRKADVTGRPPEGWLSDPEDPSMLRWWDGNEWGEFRKPA